MVRLWAVRLRSCLFPERPPTMCGISQNELKVHSAAVDWLIPSPLSLMRCRGIRGQWLHGRGWLTGPLRALLALSREHTSPRGQAASTEAIGKTGRESRTQISLSQGDLVHSLRTGAHVVSRIAQCMARGEGAGRNQVWSKCRRTRGCRSGSACWDSASGN